MAFHFSIDNTVNTTVGATVDVTTATGKRKTPHEEPVLYTIERRPNGSHRMIAQQYIPPGTELLVDTGLICLPSTLSPGLESEEYISSRVQLLEKSDQDIFMSLPNFHAGTFGDYYGRYHIYGSLIRHSPAWIGIFPKLCKARHSCRPNAVAALIEYGDDPRKDWALALRTCKAILPRMEIRRFWLDGGGIRDDRQYEHVDRFGFECNCECCELSDDESWLSDGRRGFLINTYTFMTARGALPLKDAFRNLREMHASCLDEGISDHSLSFIYGQACVYAFRCGKLDIAHIFGYNLLNMDRFCVGEDNRLHNMEPLRYFWGTEILRRISGDRQAWFAKPYLQGDPTVVQKLLNDGISLPSDAFMNHFNNFTEEREFPLYHQLPWSGDLFGHHQSPGKSKDKDQFYKKDGTPKRLWCLLASLVFIDEKKSRWLLKDKSQKMFIADMSAYVGPGDVLPIPNRTTVVFLYPSRQTLPRDDKEGIVTDPLSDVRIFNCTLEHFMLAGLTGRVKGSVGPNGMHWCYHCDRAMGRNQQDIRTCYRCHLVWWCCSTCQRRSENCGEEAKYCSLWANRKFRQLLQYDMDAEDHTWIFKLSRQPGTRGVSES